MKDWGGKVMEKRRSAYLDILRIAACIMVVGVHVSALCLENLDVSSMTFKIMNGFDCFSILGVPLFVMISGALMLESGREDNLKKLYTKALKLLCLYLFWFLFYNTVNFIENKTIWNFENIKQEIILESLLGRGIYHLWFLPMQAALYIATPFIASFKREKKKCFLFLGLFFILAIFLPTILKFDFPYKTIVSSLYGQFPNTMFAGYIGYYILGHVLHEFVPKLKEGQLLALGIVGIVSFGIEVLVCNTVSEQKGQLSIILNDTMAVNAFCTCSCIFLLVKQGAGKLQSRNIWKGAAALTFGVYLLHPFVLHKLHLMGVDTMFAVPFVSIPVVVAAVTVVTGVIVWIFSKIPFVRRLFLL